MREFEDYPVPYLSIHEIEKRAAHLRNALPGSLEPAPDIIGLAEYMGIGAPLAFEPTTLPDNHMGRAHAYVSKDGRRLLLSESVTYAANINQSWARFIVAHELGHIDLGHATFHKRPMNRIVGGNAEIKFIPPNESSEWQANAFARCFLMPQSIARGVGSATKLAALCAVPSDQAAIRFAEITNFLSGRRATSSDIVSILASQQRPSQSGFFAAQAAWDDARQIPDEDPTIYRQTLAGYRIKRSDYNKITETGWFIRNGKAISDYEYRNR